MPVIEDFAKQERDTLREEQSSEEKGSTVRQILKESKESNLFADYLAKTGHFDLLEKMTADNASERLENADILALNEARNEYLRLTLETKEIKKWLEANLDDILLVSPELRMVAGMDGKEGIKKAFLDRMEEFAIKNPAWFDDLHKKTAGIGKAQEAIAFSNEVIVDIYQSHGLSEKEYKALLEKQSKDPYAVEDWIKSRMGKFQKMFMTDVELLDRIDDLDRREQIHERIEELHASMAEMGDFMQVVMLNNKESRKILADLALGEKKQEPELSFVEVRRNAESFDFESAQEAWDKEKKEHHEEAGWNEDVEYDKFINEVVNKSLPKKRGIWATIFNTIFTSRAKSTIKK